MSKIFSIFNLLKSSMNESVRFSIILIVVIFKSFTAGIPLGQLFISCNSPNALHDPTLITGLRFTPSAFDSFIRNTEMKFTLKSPATVSIYIIHKDSSRTEFLVKTIVENLNATKGSNSVTWIGDTNQKYFAPVGTYYGIVQTQNHRFETTVQVFHF